MVLGNSLSEFLVIQIGIDNMSPTLPSWTDNETFDQFTMSQLQFWGMPTPYMRRASRYTILIVISPKGSIFNGSFSLLSLSLFFFLFFFLVSPRHRCPVLLGAATRPDPCFSVAF